MSSDDSTASDGGAAIPLDPSKAVHVFTDDLLTGEKRELEGRRFIWIHAIEQSISMLRVSIRAWAWFLDAGPQWDFRNEDFPTPVDGLIAAHASAQMAVITFLTVFKSGRPADGMVAGNLEERMKAFRARCVDLAFSDAPERSKFDALTNRLESARDGLLAHADGAAQGMTISAGLTSFRPQNDGVSREDVASLLDCAMKLSEVVRTIKAT